MAVQGFGQRKMHHGALPLPGFQPDVSAVVFDDALAKGQANAGAVVFFVIVEALKNAEHLIVVFLRNADAVVGEGKLPGQRPLLHPDGQFCRRRIVVFEGVVNEVVEQLLQLLRVQSVSLQTPTSITEELKLQTLCNNKKLNETREGFYNPSFF